MAKNNKKRNKKYDPNKNKTVSSTSLTGHHLTKFIYSNLSDDDVLGEADVKYLLNEFTADLNKFNTGECDYVDMIKLSEQLHLSLVLARSVFKYTDPDEHFIFRLELDTFVSVMDEKIKPIIKSMVRRIYDNRTNKTYLSTDEVKLVSDTFATFEYILKACTQMIFADAVQANIQILNDRNNRYPEADNWRVWRLLRNHHKSKVGTDQEMTEERFNEIIYNDMNIGKWKERNRFSHI